MVNELTLLSYNIDSDERNYKERLSLFLKQVKELEPNIVLIQEATFITYEKLFREMNIMGYKKEFSDEIRLRKEGEVIFSKLPIEKAEYIPFRHSTEMRGLTRYLINIEGHKLWICTSQFERLPAIRRKQIVQMERLFEKESVIFGGDTQIKSYERFEAPEGWFDCWYELGNEKNKFTVDWESNMSVKPPIRDRSDRFWFKVEKTCEYSIECNDYKLIGKNEDIKVSQHFGVYTKFIVE